MPLAGSIKTPGASKIKSSGAAAAPPPKYVPIKPPNVDANTGKLEDPASSEIPANLLADITRTHVPTIPQLNLRPISQLVRNILLGADGSLKGVSDGVPKLDDDGMTQVLDDIHETSCKVSCNHSGDMAQTVMEMLHVVAGYDWNAKMVVVIAAFASLFGEFCMLSRLQNEDLYAKSLDLLRGYPQVPDFTVLNKLLKTVTDLLNTNSEFMKSNVSYLLNLKDQDQFPSVIDAINYFPKATYQIIHGILQLSSLLSKKVDSDIGHTMSTMEADFTKINAVLREHLKKIGNIAEEHRKKDYKAITDIILSKDRIKIISVFMGINEEEVPESLRNKHVLFFVSNLEISVEEIEILNQFNSTDFEIIWVPIDDDELTIDENTKFKMLNSKWQHKVAVDVHPDGYAVHTYIKKDWYFVKSPIALSLNAQGELADFNVLPMLLTWGNDAFPFTRQKEDILWKTVDESGWKLEFLFPEQIDRTIRSWRQSSETLVCLFGGENITWIQEFTTRVKEVTSRTAANVALKLAYVGGSKGKGVAKSKLHGDIQVVESIYRVHFWQRLDSIFQSKTQKKKSSQSDEIMRQVMNLLGYDDCGGEWVIFSWGSEVMITTTGSDALTVMSKYNDWKAEAERTGFYHALGAYVNKLPALHGGCFHFDVAVLGVAPGKASCPKCSKQMEIYYQYRCCV